MENDNLFQLIQSMSTVEKNFFKRYAALRKDSQHQYLELFEDLSAPDPPSPSHLAEKYPRLNHRRAYLQEQLIHSLRSFGSNSRSVETRIGDHLFQYRLYTNRGLLKQARKALQKAKSLASAMEKWNFLLEIIYLERRMVFHVEKQKIKERFEELARVHADTIVKIELENLFLGAWERLLIIYRTGFGEPEAEKQAKEIIEQEIFRNGSHSTSFTAAHYHHGAKSLYALITGQYSDHLAIQKVLIQLWEAHPQQIKENSMVFIALLSNYGSSCHLVEEYDELEEILLRLKKIKVQTFGERASSFQVIAFLEQIYLMNKGHFEKARENVKSTLKGLERYKANINTARQHALLHNIMILHFVLGEYREAKGIIDRLMEGRRFRIRRDIQIFIKIILIIVHFEMGDIEMLDALTNTANAYLRRSKSPSKFLKLFLKYMGKLPDQPYASPEKNLADAKAAWTELNQIRQEPGEHAQVGVDELTAWLQSKVEGRPMKEIFIELAQEYDQKEKSE